MIADTKQLWILAGGDGTGKNRFYNLWLKDKAVEFINANIIEKKLDLTNFDQPSYEAAKVARKLYRKYIDAGRSFCFESILFMNPSLICLSKRRRMGTLSIWY